MKTFELVLSREGEKIRVCAAEMPKQTLKQYEDKDVSFARVDTLCKEVASILNRANRRGEIADRLTADLRKAGQDLFDELLTEKAKKALLTTSCTSLSLNIDDQLIHIPWELLFDGTHFLCRRFSMGRIISTRQNISGTGKRAVKGALRMLIIADPREDLSAAYREGITIRDRLVEKEKRLKVDLVSTRVDTRYVRRAIRDYDIVHYSGHAEYSEQDPSASGWLMADAPWTAADIKNLTGDTPFPFLIFSNACHSGSAGRGEAALHYEAGVYDLARSFLNAGVTHYIGTFLDVMDESGADFAVAFYHDLGGGLSLGEALRAARERIVGTHGEGNSIWASYMLYGDPAYSIPCEEKGQPVPASGKKRVLSYAAAFIAVLLMIVAGIHTLRVKTSVPPQPQQEEGVEQARPLHLSLNTITGFRAEDGSPVSAVLSAGSRLYLYERFDISAESNKELHFYCFLQGGKGSVSLIPHETTSVVRRGDHIEYTLSIEAHRLALDEAPPRAIYIAASESEIDEIEPVLWELEKIQSPEEMTPDPQRDFSILSHITISNGRIAQIN